MRVDGLGQRGVIETANARARGWSRSTPLPGLGIMMRISRIRRISTQLA